MIEVFIDFDEKDDPVISVKGVKGKACKLLTADLERKLSGGGPIQTQETPEYHEREVAKTNARVFDKRG